MADAEESPSSLAELEALAGLGGTPARDADQSVNENDAGSFDLAGLAASQVVGAPAADQDVPAAVNAPGGGAARGRWGFVLGLFAGVLVAGVLFVLLDRASAPSVVPQDDVASHAHTNAIAPSAVAVRVAPSAPVSVVETRPIAVVDPSVAAKPVRAAAGPRSEVTDPMGAPAGSEVARTAAADDDPTRPPDVAPPAAPATPSRPIDTLLDEAFAPATRAKTKQATEDNLMGAELPLTPTAADVTKVIQVLLPAIRGCAMGQSGVANTLLVVRGDGGVASASITGAPYAGTAPGRCMEGVLRRAKFPRFRQSVFRVQFPLSIRATSP